MIDKIVVKFNKNTDAVTRTLTALNYNLIKSDLSFNLNIYDELWFLRGY